MAEHELAGLRCSEVADLAPAFLLGALEPAEDLAVRNHLESCPEAHAEMAELGGVLPALYETVEMVEPPPGLKARILAAAAADTQPAADTQRAMDIVPGNRSYGPTTTRPRPVAEDRSRRWDGAVFRRPIWAGVAIAAALGVVALGAWNLQLRNELEGLTAYRNGVVQILGEAAQPGAQLALLVSPDGSGPTGLAAVAPDGQVALVMRDLAPTTGTQVYETWLIAGDAVPVAIGGFKVDGSGTASFATASAYLGAGVTVTLTLEPAPGATAPTGAIVAAGAAKGEAS